MPPQADRWCSKTCANAGYNATHRAERTLYRRELRRQDKEEKAVTRVNYAQQLQHEANGLARQKLIRSLGEGDALDAALARLQAIHARNMRTAADWVPPRMQRVLTATEVSDAVAHAVAAALITEVNASASTEQENN